jgi:hypothetical protein
MRKTLHIKRSISIFRNFQESAVSNTKDRIMYADRSAQPSFRGGDTKSSCPLLENLFLHLQRRTCFA